MGTVKGIYIHIPFCSVKCPYCDFTSITDNSPKLIYKYVQSVIKELSLYKDRFDFEIETIYFGGGTPTAIKPEYLVSIIEFINKNFNVLPFPETTVEANPNTYRYKQLKLLKDVGVNRLSIGNQTFNEKFLISLGRNHTPKDTYEMLDVALKAGITNINLDLIYGIEGQTLQDLQQDLDIYTSLPITHISAYMLTAYEDTPLGSKVLDGKYNLPEETTTTKMFFMIDEHLNSKGFKRYELSNWGKEGFWCKHNQFYWEDVEFLGVGLSAWSYVNDKRFGNTKNLYEYIEKLQNDKLPVIFEERLTPEDKLFERIMLGLRTVKGVPTDLIPNKQYLKTLMEEKFGFIKDGNFVLSPKGLMVINEIVSKLVS